MRIYLRENFTEVHVNGRIEIVQRDEEGFFIEGDSKDHASMEGQGFLASQVPDDIGPPEMTEEDFGFIDKVQRQEEALQAGGDKEPEDGSNEDSKGGDEDEDEEEKPYTCKLHGRVHKPGSALYYACLENTVAEDAKDKKAKKKD